MLSKNQIKRLLEQCKKQQPQHPREWNRITGWIEALTLVLNGDEITMNDNPINNKEKVDATRSNKDQSRNTGSVR